MVLWEMTNLAGFIAERFRFSSEKRAAVAETANKTT
jgi:hypothetical protein